MNDVIFIVDIDGTVSNSLPRVRKLCAENGIDYDSGNLDLLWSDETMMRFLYEKDMMQDEVISGSGQILDIAKICRAELVFLTGRNIYAEKPTRRWLETKLNIPNTVPLLMRPPEMKGVCTADCKEHIFKEKILSNYPLRNVTFIFFEDDAETIKRYTKYGLVLRAPDCWKVIENITICY